MGFLRSHLLICLPLLALILVLSSGQNSLCYDPIFDISNSRVGVVCATLSVTSTAVCRFFHRGSSDIWGVTTTNRTLQQDGNYLIACTFVADIGNLTEGYSYYVFVKFYPDASYEEAQAVTVNVTNPIFFKRAVITSFEANDQTSSLAVDQGEAVTFNCEATGHPDAVMTLSRGSNVVQTGASGSLSYATRLGCQTMGTYTCEANNGRSAERSIDVYVRCPLSLEDDSDFNKTFDGFLGSLTKSISFNVIGYPGPRQYTLIVKNEAAKNETEGTVVPEDQYEIGSTQSTSDISVYTVTLKFVDDKAIKATQYALVMSNGMDPPLIFLFSLDESFTEDFPVLAVALGVAGGVVALALIGGGAYFVYRHYFQEE